MLNRIKNASYTLASKRGNDRKPLVIEFTSLSKDTKKSYLLKALFHKM
jgi:hypothetical protein